MPVLPHNFPTLRHHGAGNHRPSVLILGAGMSHGQIPLPGQLLKEKREKAEIELDCRSAVPVEAEPAAEHLYQWADDILLELDSRGDSNPKLTLAESLEIPNDSRWLGRVGTSRSHPRHRVIARFAREGLWHHIWSLNWDCVQECALENVGIKRSRADEQMPWPTVFHTFVTAAECARMGETASVKVFKPHGCVMALVEAQQAKADNNLIRSLECANRFLITATELQNLDPSHAGDPAQEFIFATLIASLSSQPFVAAGWSASEGYLIDRIDAVVRPILQDPARQPPIADDELSVIDIEFNSAGHTRLASFYGKNAASAHINVGQPGFRTDDFFLWLQAVYALGCLRLHALEHDKATVEELAADIEQPPHASVFTIDWVDNFLPVWVRFCWRIGLVRCQSGGGDQIHIDSVALESRDEHIPWTLPNIERPEIIAASRILVALSRSGHGIDWSYSQFPGGLYSDFRLIIPVPMWEGEPPNDLRGLKPLIDAIKFHGAGYIERVVLAFVGLDTESVISDERKWVWKQLVARELSMARFASAESIEDLQLEDL